MVWSLDLPPLHTHLGSYCLFQHSVRCEQLVTERSLGSPPPSCSEARAVTTLSRKYPDVLDGVLLAKTCLHHRH